MSKRGIFTFAAFAASLSVHGTTRVIDPSGPATSLGYSGEHFDAKAQQQYLRARFYDPVSGRFNRLDPFAGNMQDPQSLHKYAYVHGDPIQGVDPTGWEFTVAGFSAASMVQGALRGMAIGGVTGAVTGAADAWLGGGDTDDIRDAALYGGMAGAVLGLFTGGLAGPAATGFSSLSVVARVRILKSLLSLNLAASGYGVYTSRTTSQGTFRAALGFIGTLGLLRAVQVARASQISTRGAAARHSLAKALDDDGGHSFQKHGAHTTPGQHKNRLLSGIAPGDPYGPLPPNFNIPKRSGKFATHKVHVDAYERALVKLWSGPAVDPGTGIWKQWQKVVIDLKGVGTSFSLDSADNLVSTKADRVLAIFRRNDAGDDYILYTMYPVP